MLVEESKPCGLVPVTKDAQQRFQGERWEQQAAVENLANVA